MPNKIAIASGTIDDITGLTYNRAIPICTTHKMTLRSTQEPNDCDVIIDWGDGTIDSIKNGNYVSHTVGKSYELSHDYSETMTQDIQRFIVKIYGKDYYTFRHNSYKTNNLISRIFSSDLPIASFITNFSSMAVGAVRLLKVEFPHSTKPFSSVWNWSSCFNECANIVSITGFEDIKARGDAIYDSFMAACGNLTTTDFVIPASITDIPNIFTGDTKLVCNINNLIPKYGFSSSNISINSPFSHLTSMSGTVPADKLWNDKRINWIFKSTSAKPFSNCSPEIKAQVPTSWGGTNAEIQAQIDSGYFNLVTQSTLEEAIPVKGVDYWTEADKQ